MPTTKMLFAQLGTGDVDEVFQLLTDDHIQGIHKPSWYTISSVVNLYGEICGAIRIDGTLRAVSLNFPYLKNDGVYIYLFAVDIEQQRKGIGSYLFTSMAKMLREMGYRKISLRVLKNNQGALRFWLAKGFIPLPGQVSDDVDAFAENFLECAL